MKVSGTGVRIGVAVLVLGLSFFGVPTSLEAQKAAGISRVTISVLLLAVGLSGAVAQSPSDDRRLISRRSIQLTAEQEYVIRENVKDVRGAKVAQNVAPKVGEKIPSGVELNGFPSLVIEKVPQSQSIQILRHQGSDRARIATKYCCRCDQEKAVADRPRARIYRKDTAASVLNIQRGFRKLRSVRENNLKKWH